MITGPAPSGYRALRDVRIMLAPRADGEPIRLDKALGATRAAEEPTPSWTWPSR